MCPEVERIFQKKAVKVGKAWLVALIFAGVGFLLLLGLPGAVVVMSAWPTTNLIFGPLAYQTWEANLGDRAWPLMIMVSIIWPFLIPLGFYSVTRLFPERPFFSPKKFSVFLLILVFGCVILGQTVIVLTGVKRLPNEERSYDNEHSRTVDYLESATSE